MAKQTLSTLQKTIEEIADQLCLAVKGDFDFTIKIESQDESIQKLTMLVNFLVDTARRALIDVRDKNYKLMEVDYLKSEFITNISHELRTPLTLILSPLKTILLNEASSLPADVTKNLYRMQRNAARLYILVNNLLDFTKIEANKFELYEESVDLNQFIAQLIDDIQGLAQERKINLQFFPAPAIKQVLLDKKIIEKIVFNLLSNALKFTSPEGEIKVILQRGKKTIDLLVTDTGTGIPQDQIPFVFERFHQVDSSSTRAYEGSGIGLTLVKQFVELMHGNIRVESRVGKGSSFHISLPERTAQAPPTSTKSETLTSSTPHNFKVDFSLLATPEQDIVPLPTKTALKKERPFIVIADDNRDIRHYITSLLENNFDVIAVENGKLALDAVHQYKPHVILSDIMMPLIDGYQLTKLLKEDPSTTHIPIILITAKAGNEAVVSSLGVGADDYLSKPFEPEELIARTTAACNHYQTYLQNCDLNSQLITMARQAGMTELATSILHNIGNVLNTVNVSIDLIKEMINKPYVPHLTAVSTMLKENITNLAYYLSKDEKGKILPDYLIALVTKITTEYDKIDKEITCLAEQVHHIGDIVTMQESISGVSGIAEKLFLPEIVNTAISMCKNAIDKQEVTIHQEVEHHCELMSDKAKLLQIIINLIQNAKDALTDPKHNVLNKTIKIKIRLNPITNQAELIISDNGIGITAENLGKIFTFGFTTKSHGHGFGLHASALAAKELGGTLLVKSKGFGQGAEFTLALPLKQPSGRFLNDDSYEGFENSHY
ncbi:ATP-binding protein [Legionella feeleii]|uniref:histidine kinase n=1 Tax=Legionella feeleii TaxID=453 RepID=A0A378IPA9_9GAMM|nr:ATP-binding protein [Legionella feeleii]STX37046.1 Two-component sensor histidine kinase [Legionella feeleii]